MMAPPENNDKTAVVASPVKRLVIPFASLPLGTRFKYNDKDNKNIYVILSKSGCGLVVKWEDSLCNSHLVQVMSAFESEHEAQSEKVVIETVKTWKIESVLCDVWTREKSADDGYVFFESLLADLGIDLIYE